jgi:hypothetical protein
MRMVRHFLLAIWFLPLVWGSDVDFAHQVVPILKTHCADCHLGAKKKGGLSMNTKEALMTGSENGKIVFPGNAADSLLVKVISSHDPEIQMPPKGKRLGEGEIGILRAWIDQGIFWEEGFSFKKPAYEPPLKPRRPELPVAAAGRDHPVDRILDAYLVKQSLPAPAALGDGAFFRRLHLDLIGLLPEPAKLEAFLADTAVDKRTRLVRELLDSSQAYAEHWLTFWNDLLRNDYAGTGYIDGGRKQISAWLYQALLTNKPYDHFVKELVSPTEASEGFGRGIKWRGQVSAGQEVPVQFAQSMGQAFLGINLKCASCHDSFIDRWKLDEAYGLAAVFSTEPLEIHRCDKPTGRKAQPAWLFPELGQIDAGLPPKERLKQLALLMTHPENGRLTRTVVNRLWHRLMGRGIVHPVDAMQSEPWSSDLLDFLAVDLADHGYDLKHTMALICSSQAYQSVSELIKEGEAGEYQYAGPRAKRLTAEQFADAIWQITGAAPKKFDAPIKRAGESKSPRLDLTAKWIWSGDQRTQPAASGESVTFRSSFELSALPKAGFAVMTCDNSFKCWLNGKKISESDNWESPLVVNLTEHLRIGTNEIVLVGTNGGREPNPAGLFFQAQLRFADGAVQDLKSDAGWLWNTATPDANGRLLQDQAEWKPVAEVEPGVWKGIRDRMRGLLADSFAGGGAMVRAALLKSDLLMRSLGRPNREQIVSMRPNDLTTLEAMDLNNGQILTSRLEEGARAILKEKSGISTTALIQWLYAFAYSRSPSATEIAVAQEALGAPPGVSSLQDLLWAMLVQPEFQMVR